MYGFNPYWIPLEVSKGMPSLNQPPDSQFAYVVVAARRARQLMTGAMPLLSILRSSKYTRIAMEELNKGMLEFSIPEIPESADDKESKRRKS